MDPPRDDLAGRNPPSSGRPGQSGQPLNVLIVDDSVVVRRVLAKVLKDDPRFQVIGTLSDGTRALAFVRSHPVDLVMLDMNMPGENGLIVLAKLMAHDRRLNVVLLSAACREGSETALEALAIGASDVIAKPEAGHFSPAFTTHLRDRLTHLVPAKERVRKPERVDQTSARIRPLGSMVRAIGIGASTGGIGAVTAVLSAFDAPLPVPIFITQHLPANFQPLFAEQLRQATQLPIVIAEEGMEVRAGTAYVAPGRAHLSLERKPSGLVTIRYSNEACLHGGHPAVDPMFRALAHVYGPGACGIILSGMGRDGLAGALAIVEAGGWMLAQDHDSSAVWGMPGSVVKAGLASAIQPPANLARIILRQRQAAA